MADELTPQKVTAAGVTSFTDPGMTQEQNVAGQMQARGHVPSVNPPVHPTPPPQYYPPQHHLPLSAYGVPGQHTPQIAEFAVPVDHHRGQMVVVNQPQVLHHAPQIYVPDEMCFSVFTMLCCCCCLGIPAMIFASQANSLRLIYPERALQKAKVARALNITAVVFGVIAITVMLILRYAVLNEQYH